jgi:FkbM family methyltransferase
MRRLVYDVGAHRGEDTHFYLSKGFDVVAVEANPRLAAEIRMRFADAIAAGRLRLVEAAIAAKAGKVPFYENTRVTQWGTTSPEWAARNEMLGAASIAGEVPAITFREVLEAFGMPYYLKIDIEGADRLCLHDLAGFADRPAHVSIESDKVSWQALLDEFSMLQSLGYDRFKVIDQAAVSRQRPPRPAREGDYVDYRFESGATGLFGAESPGKWLTREQAIARYRVIFATYRLIGDYSPWRRLVRHVPLVRRLSAHWYDTHATRLAPAP